MKKRFLMVAALALTAAPAFAEITRNADGVIMVPRSAYTVIPLDVDGNPIDDGARTHYGFDNRVGGYNNLQLGRAGATNYLINNGVSAAYPLGRFVGDDFHMGRKATDFTGFLWLYTDNGPSEHASTVAFFNNTAMNGAPGPAFGATMTMLVVTSMGTISTAAVLGFAPTLPEATPGNPNGFWGISVTHLTLAEAGLQIISAGSHGWMGFRSKSVNPTRGGMRATQFVPDVGTSTSNLFHKIGRAHV